MRKSKSNKSAKSQNNRFKKPNRKQRQTVSRKTVARNTKSKSSTINKKSSVKAPSPSVPKPRDTSKPLKGEIRKAAGGASSKNTDKRLVQLEKGRAVRQLYEQGYSHEKLAEKFQCSKSLVRDLIYLGGLPKDLEEAYLQKELDRKKVLEKTRARKNPNKPTVPVTPEIPPKITSRNPPPKQAAVVRSEKTHQNPPSPMNEEGRQEKISEYAQLIVDWMPQTGLRPCDYRSFFKQVESALDGTRPWLFSNEAPKPDEINPNENPREVINRCKPEDGNPQTAPEVTNNAVTWLARWAQRLIPDKGIMKEAISKAKAKALLLDQAQ